MSESGIDAPMLFLAWHWSCCGARMISRRGPATVPPSPGARELVPALDPFGAPPCSVFYTLSRRQQRPAYTPTRIYDIHETRRLRPEWWFPSQHGAFHAPPQTDDVIAQWCWLLAAGCSASSLATSQSQSITVDPPTYTAPLPIQRRLPLRLRSEVSLCACDSTAATSRLPRCRTPSVAPNAAVLLCSRQAAAPFRTAFWPACACACACALHLPPAPLFRLPPSCHRSLHARDKSRPPAAASAAGPPS